MKDYVSSIVPGNDTEKKIDKKNSEVIDKMNIKEKNVEREQEKNEILILMSTYNGEKYIEEQIDSIENQKVDIPLHILIRDDGSVDNTIECIKKLSSKYKNIELINGDNIGCNASFFELFKVAKNFKYYAISDQDDIWLPNKLQTGLNYLKNEDNKKPLLFGSCSFLYDGEKIVGTTQKQLKASSMLNSIIQNYCPGHSQMFNAQLLKIINNDIVDCTKIYVYDYWILNVAMLYGKVIFCNTPLTKYRIHSSNTLGYGKSKFQWIKERKKRIKNGDCEKIYRQIKYFYELHSNNMSTDNKKEINKFILYNSSIIKRTKFVLFTKMYRQKNFETILFKTAYFLKKYK